MPVEIVPHMYRMLADEIQWARDDGEPYHFSHLLVLSRTYTISEEEAETASVFKKLASHSLDFSFSNALPRENDSFGLEQGCRLNLLVADKLPQLISDLSAAFP